MQRTPLHVAASKGRDYTVECLVQKKANLNIKDKNGVGYSILLVVVQYCYSTAHLRLSTCMTLRTKVNLSSCTMGWDDTV